VAEFDLLCTVQSDKASVDVTARRAGVVARLAAAVGDIVQVGAPLLEMRVDDGGGEVAATAASAAAPVAAGAPPSPPSPPPHASPAVRRVAKELGVPLAAVAGTGPAGRVVKADVEAAAGRGAGAPAAPPTLPTPDTTTLHPLRGYRRAMVAAMQAAAAVPHFHLHASADASRVLAARAALAADPSLAGARLTLLPFLVKALALTAAAFPDLNASLADGGASVARHARVHVGVAVDTPAGLAVPVVRDVQALSLAAIAAEVGRLAAAAAGGALGPADTGGGTITLSNVGALGPAGHATPLLLVPQTCILAVGRAAETVVPDGAGGVRVEPRLPLSWGADHRVVDGATLARASAHFEGLLAEPARMLLHTR
jgi:2-oxoisovalerate dehydrogenase E2 component (dihydrolipoyl transacylase)